MTHKPLSMWLGLYILSCPPLIGIAQGHAIFESDDSLEFIRCTDSGEASMGIMPAIFDCQRAEQGRKNRKLNETYRATLKAFTLEQQQRLRRLERLWIVERDRKCIAEADREGGTTYSDSKLAFYGCHLRETDRRIDWLKSYARNARAGR